MKILVDPLYNPIHKSQITSGTKLAPGITCAKFLGAKGSRTQFEKLYADNFMGPCDRHQIARNLVLHANAMNSVFNNPDFSQHRLVVSEGIYEPNPKFETVEQEVSNADEARLLSRSVVGASFGKSGSKWVVRVPTYVGEVPTPGSVNDLRRTGRAIVYQLVDANGKCDPKKTFDLCVYWKDYLNYNKITLAYDTFDPSGELTCSIILEMPQVPESFSLLFNYDLETTFNNELQAKNELLEITQ